MMWDIQYQIYWFLSNLPKNSLINMTDLCDIKFVQKIEILEKV